MAFLWFALRAFDHGHCSGLIRFIDSLVCKLYCSVGSLFGVSNEFCFRKHFGHDELHWTSIPE